MPTKRHIAAVMELNWPYKRHYEIFAGIQEYAQNHAHWSFDLGVVVLARMALTEASGPG